MIPDSKQGGSDWAAAYTKLPKLRIDETIGGSSFPLGEAVAFSYQSVTLRLGRILIVIVGVALAVAFMAALIVMGEMFKGLSQLFDTEAGGEDFYKWWLVVAVLISAVGITNSMLMSVTERIKEIGTLKCLGATWLHILEIFLLESVFIGLIGGVAGGVLGLVFAAANFGFQFGAEALTLMTPGTVCRGMGAGVVIAVVLCLLSSIYPVYYASKIQAADALRYEV